MRKCSEDCIPICEYGFGMCDTTCPHWQGTFCELDLSLARLALHYTPKAKPKFIIYDESKWNDVKQRGI